MRNLLCEVQGPPPVADCDLCSYVPDVTLSQELYRRRVRAGLNYGCTDKSARFSSLRVSSLHAASLPLRIERCPRQKSLKQIEVSPSRPLVSASGYAARLNRKATLENLLCHFSESLMLMMKQGRVHYFKR